MSGKMPNIKLLRNDLRNNGWVITAFPFKYNNVECHVIFEDIKAIKNCTDPYYIAYLTFIDLDNNTRRLETLANTQKFSASIQQIRDFFHIQYQDNLIDFLSHFYQYFQLQTPNKMPNLNNNLKQAIVEKINHRENNPNAIFCYKVKRNGKSINGKQCYRTAYNNDKTRLLYPDLYNYFKDDRTISFCYSENPLDEKSQNELITQFIDSSKPAYL